MAFALEQHETNQTSAALKEREMRIYFTIMVIFCCAIIISNVLASKTILIGFFTLPASILVFPIVYILNDALSDIFGFKKARRVIYAGFIGALSAAVAFQIAILIPGADPAQSAAFSQSLGNSLRILLGSFISYLAGSLLNSYVMTRLKKRFGRNLFFRCIVSTVLGESVDSIIFISIAFAGIFEPQMIITMIASQIFMKSAYEVVAYPVTKRLINHARRSIGKETY